MGTMGPAATITTGIQDVAALLPLLGTAQCEDHISSALSKGYLYIAATPLSIFGSLGIARAGFKTLMASFAIARWNVVGARRLVNMGFEPRGTNLSLIMMDEDNHYLIENRVDTLLKELHIDCTKRVDIVTKCLKWNVTMMLYTAIVCTLSITPYIPLNIHRNSHLSDTARWIFPVLRALGGFLTATMIQLVIQSRIATLTRNRLATRRGNNRNAAEVHLNENQSSPPEPEKDLGVSEHSNNPESGPSILTVSRNLETSLPSDIEKGLKRSESDPSSILVARTTAASTGKRDVADGNSVLTWCLLILLLIGVLASIIGYVGCFTVVQSTQSTAGPLIWLCLEAGLSIIRIFVWSINSTSDHAPPLELKLTLDDHAPLPTCEKYDDEIQEVLPLTRSDQFLEAVTSAVGLVERFDDPALTLYYTLTRKRVLIGPVCFLRGRVLYITVFDYKERTARIFTGGPEGNRFYSTGSEVPIIDLERYSIKVKFGEPIDPANDPVISKSFIQSISNHHQSIMASIFSAATDPNRTRTFSIFNGWTMRMADTETSTVKGKGGDEKQNRWDNKSNLSDFPQLEMLVKRRQSLVETRGEWIDAYMEVAREEMMNSGLSMPTRVDGVLSQDGYGREDNEKKTIEMLLVEERFHMEILLVYEVAMLEVQLFDKSQRLLLGGDAGVTMWTLDCQTRLEAEMRAADRRINAASRQCTARDNEISRRWSEAHDQIRQAWNMVWEQSNYIHDLSHRPKDFNHLIHDLGIGVDEVKHRIDEAVLDAAEQERCRKQWRRAMERLKREVEDVQWRLNRGLEHCGQFWSDRQLAVCRHSSSKWLELDRNSFQAPLGAYSNELKKRSDLICIFFWYFTRDDAVWIVSTLRDMRSVTSIRFHDYSREKLALPSIKDNHHLLSIEGRFVSTSKVAALNRNRSLLERTPRTFVFTEGWVLSGGLGSYHSELRFKRNSTITISFVGPTSRTLTLRLVHRSFESSTTLTIQVSSTFELSAPMSYITDDITLYPSPSDQLSFEPGTRNQLTLIVNSGSAWSYDYCLRDLQLLDDSGKPYNPPV